MLIWLTPWRRGPLLLLRRPGVALALVAAAFVATLPAAAAPLFLSSAENATLHRQIDQSCPWSVGARVGTRLYLGPRPGYLPDDHPLGAQVFDRRAQALERVAPPGLTAPVFTLSAQVDAVPVGRPAADPTVRGLNLVGQDGFAPQVRVIAGPDGDGIWVPDTFAKDQGLRVGDRLTVVRRGPMPFNFETEMPEQPYQVRLAAIFQDLRSLPDQSHWCGLRDVYRGAPGQEFSNTPVLPMALVGTRTFLELGTSVRMMADYTAEYAVADPHAPVTRAAVVSQGLTRMNEQMRTVDPVVLGDTQLTYTSLLDRQVRRAELVRTGLLPPVLPITAAGVLVGLAVVAAAAIFWVQRRRPELTVLAAHGVSPAGLGLKAVTEAFPAVLVGTAGGAAAAWALVRWTGPSPVFDPGTTLRAMAVAALVALVAIGLVGAVAAARCRALADHAPTHRRGGWWRRVPWELALLAAAPLAWREMAGSRTVEAATDGGVGEIAHVPARLLVVPILVIAGCAMLLGRLAAGRLRSRGLRRTPSRPARLLAWRRLVRDAVTTAVLAGATAVPIAMASYGASVTESLRTTADAEVRMLLGADVVATMRPEGGAPAIPAALSGRATGLLRIDRQAVNGVIVDILLVDPATFTEGAFWDDRIDGPRLSDAVASLTPGNGAPAVVVASRLLPPGRHTLFVVDRDVPVDVVAVQPLPGEQGGYPVLLMHKDAYPNQPVVAGRELWIRGQPKDTRAEVADAGLPLIRLTTIDDLRGGAVYEPVTYTFHYLIALSVFTGLIAVVGLLLYLESRTASHRRAFVLLRRLGLRPGVHRRALLLELAAPVLAGLLAGLGLAGGLAYALGDSFEIDPTEPPAAILVLPITMVVVVSASAIGVAVGAALLAHRRIRRAQPSEVLRDTP